MILHIIKENERLSDILDYYNVEYEDIKVNNLHITDFKNLRAGMRLKIPILSSNISQILDKTEPLVKDYYQELVDREIKDQNKVASIMDQTKPSEEIRNTVHDENEFKGLNFIRPKKLFGFPNIKKEIYPHFKDNKKEKSG